STRSAWRSSRSIFAARSAISASVAWTARRTSRSASGAGSSKPSAVAVAAPVRGAAPPPATNPTVAPASSPITAPITIVGPSDIERARPRMSPITPPTIRPTTARAPVPISAPWTWRPVTSPQLPLSSLCISARSSAVSTGPPASGWAPTSTLPAGRPAEVSCRAAVSACARLRNPATTLNGVSKLRPSLTAAIRPSSVRLVSRSLPGKSRFGAPGKGEVGARVDRSGGLRALVHAGRVPDCRSGAGHHRLHRRLVDREPEGPRRPVGDRDLVADADRGHRRVRLRGRDAAALRRPGPPEDGGRGQGHPSLGRAVHRHRRRRDLGGDPRRVLPVLPGPDAGAERRRPP